MKTQSVIELIESLNAVLVTATAEIKDVCPQARWLEINRTASVGVRLATTIETDTDLAAELRKRAANAGANLRGWMARSCQEAERLGWPTGRPVA